MESVVSYGTMPLMVNRVSMRWSGAAGMPSFRRLRRVGWPMGTSAKCGTVSSPTFAN